MKFFLLFFLIFTITYYSSAQILIVSQISVKDQSNLKIIGNYAKRLEVYSYNQINNEVKFDTVDLINIIITCKGFRDTIIDRANLKNKTIVNLYKDNLNNNDIIVKSRQLKTFSNYKTTKSQKLHFNLSSDWTYVFSIPANIINLVNIKSFEIKLHNYNNGDSIKISIYENLNAAIINATTIEETFAIDKNKNNYSINLVNQILTDTTKSDFFYVGITANKPNSNKIFNRLNVLTKLIEAPTLILINDKKKNMLIKYPMDNYYKNFKAYPQLTYEIKYY